MEESTSTNEVMDTLATLAASIEQSEHKELICGGLSLISHFLDGKPLCVEGLHEPLQKSVKLLGEKVEKQMLENVEHLENEEDLRVCRFAGKVLKSKLLATIGASISPEEKTELQEDKDYVLDLLSRSLEEL